VDDASGCIALCQFVNVVPLCCDRVNSALASVCAWVDVVLGLGVKRCLIEWRVRVEVGGGVFTVGGSLGWHQRLGWGRYSGYCLSNC
jgi:hypothetical protein